MNNTSQFGDFLVAIVTKYLNERNVVKISSSPSCYIYLGSHPLRRGRNPETGEEIVREAGKNLEWFIPKYDDDFTEDQFLESLKRNNIELIVNEFPTIQNLLDEAKELYGEFLPIVTIEGATLVELYFDNNQFWWLDAPLQNLLEEFPAPQLAYDKDRGLKIKKNS